MKIIWQPLALHDLWQLREYIAQENPAASKKVGRRIEAVVEHLARHPEMGRPGRRAGTRELILSDLPFRIVYRLRGEVQILRIYHTKRKWPSH